MILLGDVYVGDWHEGKQCGFGTLTKSYYFFSSHFLWLEMIVFIAKTGNGDVYEGEWLNGRFKAPWKVAHN